MYKKAIKKTAKRTDRTYYVGCYVDKEVAQKIAEQQSKGRKITDIVGEALKCYFDL